MIKFAEVKFSSFVELVNFLKFTDEDVEAFNITKRLQRFIKDISTTQMLSINSIVTEILDNNLEIAELEFNDFLKEFPDTEFDPDGRLDLTPINHFEIKLQSAEMLVGRAQEILNQNKKLNPVEYTVNKQVLDAKSLEPLISMTRRKRVCNASYIIF